MPRGPRIPMLKQAQKRRSNSIREFKRQRLIALRATRRAAAKKGAELSASGRKAEAPKAPRQMAARPGALRAMLPGYGRIPAVPKPYAPAGRLVPGRAAMPGAAGRTTRQRILRKATATGAVLPRARARALTAMPARALKHSTAKAMPWAGSTAKAATAAKPVGRRVIVGTARAGFGAARMPGKRAVILRKFLLPEAAIGQRTAAPFEARAGGAARQEKAKAIAKPKAKVIAPPAKPHVEAQPQPVPPRRTEIPKGHAVAARAPEGMHLPIIPEKHILTIRAPKRIAYYESRPPEKGRWWQGAAGAGGIDPKANRKVLGRLGIAEGSRAFQKLVNANSKELAEHAGGIGALAKSGLDVRSFAGVEDIMVLGSKELEEIARNAGGDVGDVLRYGVAECAKAGAVKDAESLRILGEIARNAGGNAEYVLGYGVAECAKAGAVKDAESLRAVGKEIVEIAQHLPAGIDMASSLRSMPPFKSPNELHAFAEGIAKFDGNIGSIKNPDAKRFVVTGLAGVYAEDNNFAWDAEKFVKIYNKYENFRFHPGLITKGSGFGLKAGSKECWEFKKDTSGRERLFSSPSFGKLSNLNKPWDANGLYDVMLAGGMRPGLGREEWVGRNSALDAGAQEKLLVDALKMLKPEKRKEVFPKCFAFALWREGIAYPKLPANVNDAAPGREFLESEYELLKHANEFWAGRGVEFGEPKYTKIISDEMHKVRKDLHMEKIAIEVDGSIGLLNAFDGARGQTCIANYGELVNDKRYMPLAFNEVREVGGKSYKINHGVVHAVDEKVNGERALVIFGIEPKKELLARCSTSEFVGKAVEEIKKVAKANGIGRVYISLESGETSNKKDVIDVVMKLVKGRTKITTNFPMEASAKERNIGEL